MIKRELKINFKNFIIWTGILIAMFLLVFLVYPSIVDSLNKNALDEMLAMFPKDVLSAFNMDITSIDNAFGWLKSEGYIFILLITGLYSALLGSNILLKEENDKTILFLISKPISRGRIVISKIFVGVFNIFLMIACLTIFNYIGLSFSCDFSCKQFIYLMVGSLFSSLVIFFITLFISTFFHKNKKTFGISFGIVFISYFLLVFSQINDKIEFLKYFSIYTLSDGRNVILNNSFSFNCVIISAFISVVFAIFTYLNYNKKELI